MVVASVKIVVSPDKRQKVVNLLRPIIEPTLVQPGCLSCRIYQDVNDEDILTYEEIWHDQEKLDRHIRSESYENILAAMDLASRPPKIHFNTIAHSGGVEVIYAARRVEHASA
jgi:quinol monooxygenase YgiN